MKKSRQVKKYTTAERLHNLEMIIIKSSERINKLERELSTLIKVLSKTKEEEDAGEDNK